MLAALVDQSRDGPIRQVVETATGQLEPVGFEIRDGAARSRPCR